MTEGFVYYRLPNSKEIIGRKGYWQVLEDVLHFQSGFLVTSFLKDHIFNMMDYSSVDLSFIEGFDIHNQEKAYSVSKEEYFDQVDAGVSFCKQSNGKVVLSRVKRFNTVKGHNIKNMFQALCDNYSNAFVYLLNIPNYGTWIGATPEKLLVGEIPIFKMDSLAGSRSLEDPFDWTDKEINEQQMVTNFIEEKLNHSGIKFHKSPTETVQAGNIEHLHTEFVTENCFSPMDLVENLHPTPAVSGIPREPAIDFISQTEKHSRKLYSGIIGIAQEGMYNLFVNLRCAELRKDSVDLFVGGGLTKDSIKEVEWNETEFKSQTLLSVIEKM